MNKEKVSIIIICEKLNTFLIESLPYYAFLNYKDFLLYIFSTEKIELNTLKSEILANFKISHIYMHLNLNLSSNEFISKLDLLFNKIVFISDPSLKHQPSKRRDLSIKYSRGELFAFIDDDAFPTPYWLDKAVNRFNNNKDLTAVCGPGITPKIASELEKASGLVSGSMFGGFGSTYRFFPEKGRYVVDFPSMNFIVNSDDFKLVNGFDSNYYPGEDTKLCLDLIEKTGKKIYYDPEILIYHHKRELFKSHLVVNGRYGKHRGHFARILPSTSSLWFYYVPSLFSIGIIAGTIISFISFFIVNSYILLLLVAYNVTILLYYIILLMHFLWSVKKSESIIISFYSVFGVAATHFWYGIKFIEGYFSKNLLDNYGRYQNK